MPVFQQVTNVQIFQNGVKIFYGIGGTFGNIVIAVFKKFGSSGLQHIEHQNGMMRRKGTPRFRNHIRMRQRKFFAGFKNGIDDVVGVFLNGVIYGACRRTAAAVIIDTESPADIHKFDSHSKLFQLHIKFRNFPQAGFDFSDVRNLAAEMTMDKLDAVAHILLANQVHRIEKFRTAQPKLAVVSAGLLPFPLTAGRQFNAEPDIRLDADAPGNFNNHREFGYFFHNDVDVLSHLLREQRQLDKIFVLIAVAYNQRIRIVHIRQNRMKFRFGSRFQSDVELFTVAHDFF